MRSMGVPSAGLLMATWVGHCVVAGFFVEAWVDEDAAESG